MNEQIEQIEIDFVGFYGVFIEKDCVAAFQYRSEADIFARNRLTLMDWTILELGRKVATGEPDETLAEMACRTCD